MYKHNNGHTDVQMNIWMSEHTERCMDIHTDILILHLPAQ